MHDVGFRLEPEVEPRAIRSATNVTVSVECENVVLRGDQLRSMTVMLAMSADGTHFATGSGSLSWLPERTFDALRARNGARPTADDPAAAMLGSVATPAASRYRALSDALLVAEDPLPDRRRVLIPIDHPVYFDHPLDHAPGMLLIDAAWQAASATRPDERLRLIECSMKCPAFTELFGEAWVFLKPITTGQIDFWIEQSGRTTAMGELHFRRTVAAAAVS